MSVEFHDYSMQVMAALEEKCEQWLYEAAGEIESQAKRNATVDTGQTKNSYKYVVDTGNKVAYVGSNLENAIWEEFGTGEHALNHDGRKTPWYIPVDSFKGKKQPTYEGKVVVVYGRNGKVFYKTDGKKPKRTLYKAFNSKKSALKRRLESLLRGM